jgi:hypothetical protein
MKNGENGRMAIVPSQRYAPEHGRMLILVFFVADHC